MTIFSILKVDDEYTLNRIPVMAPISAPILGVSFFGGVSPSKMGRFAPFLATIQAISKICVFLSNKRSEGCFVWATPPHYCPFQLSFSWGSNPARVKASKRGAKSYPRWKYFSFRRGPGGRCSISEIYHWDGQTVLSAHRLFRTVLRPTTRGMQW
jgi:hypothetical protein